MTYTVDLKSRISAYPDYPNAYPIQHTLTAGAAFVESPGDGWLLVTTFSIWAKVFVCDNATKAAAEEAGEAAKYPSTASAEILAYLQDNAVAIATSGMYAPDGYTGYGDNTNMVPISKGDWIYTSNSLIYGAKTNTLTFIPIKGVKFTPPTDTDTTT